MRELIRSQTGVKNLKCNQCRLKLIKTQRGVKIHKCYQCNQCNNNFNPH